VSVFLDDLPVSAPFQRCYKIFGPWQTGEAEISQDFYRIISLTIYDALIAQMLQRKPHNAQMLRLHRAQAIFVTRINIKKLTNVAAGSRIVECHFAERISISHPRCRYARNQGKGR